MRILAGTLVFAAVVLAQTPTSDTDPIRSVVGRLEFDGFKADIKALTQFGDRQQGTQRNRDAVDWLEKQLRNYGYSNVARHRFDSADGPQDTVYATKIGAAIPGEMYIVSAHMDGRGGGEAADDDGSGCALVLELARVLAMPDVRTNRSVRLVFWNHEEFGMDGSKTYARDRVPKEGTAAEPKLLGVIQHDMILFDHGLPAGPKQIAGADINIEYKQNSKMAAESAKLAAALQEANRVYAHEYRASIGDNMAGTDSVPFQDLVATVSVREAERVKGITAGSNPNHHESTDNYANYNEQDFRLGFTTVQTTMGAIGKLAGVSVTTRN